MHTHHPMCIYSFKLQKCSRSLH